jgi:hypothetical protein
MYFFNFLIFTASIDVNLSVSCQPFIIYNLTFTFSKDLLMMKTFFTHWAFKFFFQFFSLFLNFLWGWKRISTKITKWEEISTDIQICMASWKNVERLESSFRNQFLCSGTKWADKVIQEWKLFVITPKKMAFEVNCEGIKFLVWKCMIYFVNLAFFYPKCFKLLAYDTSDPRNHSNIMIQFPEPWL